jgi:hypothetical protein
MQNTGKNRLGANQSLGEIAIPVAITPTGEISGSSIFRDLQQGRPIEADQIIGDLARPRRESGHPDAASRRRLCKHVRLSGPASTIMR